MFYNEFLKLVEKISPEERDKFVPLQGWAGMDRASIDKIDFANNTVKITCKHIIMESFHLGHFRVDGEGRIYINADTYKTFDPEWMKQRCDKQDEPGQGPVPQLPASPEITYQHEDAEAATQRVASSQASREHPHPGVSAKEAEGQQLADILEYYEYLKSEGRAEEIDDGIPF